jgi:hypothetical protein
MIVQRELWKASFKQMELHLEMEKMEKGSRLLEAFLVVPHVLLFGLPMAVYSLMTCVLSHDLSESLVLSDGQGDTDGHVATNGQSEGLKLQAVEMKEQAMGSCQSDR